MVEVAPALAEDDLPGSARHPLRGVLLVGTAAAFFAFNGSVSKVVLTSGISSMRLTELRCAATAVCLGLVVAVVAPERLRVRRHELLLLASFGVVGVAGTQVLYFVALQRMPVGVALLLEFTAPVMVALWARFVMRQAVRQRVWVALALSVGGLALVAEVWRGGGLSPLGVTAALIAAVALAAYYLLGEHSASHRDPLSTTFWAFVFATVMWSVIQPWWSYPFHSLRGSTDLGGHVSGHSLPIWLLLTSMVVLGTVVPFSLALAGLHHLPATRAGVVGMLEPPLAGVVAWIWLGEALSVGQLIGAVIVLAGIVLAQTARPEPDQPTPELP